MAPDPTDDDLAPWRRAVHFEDLGALTARFLEGRSRYFPGWLAPDVDEETDELLPALVHCNRAGFLTLASQPGRAPYTGFGGHRFSQRAFVAGFASPSAARALESLAFHPELLLHTFPATKGGGSQVPVSRRGDTATAWSGHAAGPEELEIFAEVLSPAGLESLRRSRYVALIDPEWDRRELLWDALVGALELPTHDKPSPS